MKEHGSVLLVDDNADLLKSLSAILTRSGYEVDMAENGLMALDKYRNNRFDVILMDVVMPGMSGVEAFRRIKEMNPAARVILMSAYYEDDIITEVMKEGVHTALCKPVDVAWVIHLIQEIVSDQAVMIVDDDPDLCKTMAKMFEMQGYSVTTACSGEEAVEIMNEKMCQIAFIDLKLPLMDGLETYWRLREIDPGIKAVMITAYREEMSDLMKQAFQSMPDSCLFKPFHPAEALEMASKIKRNKRPRRCRNI